MDPNFGQPVPDHGYAWWYIDALSEDGRHGLTLIAFIGSVFSPYYARARRRCLADSTQRADPLQFCSLNVALYGDGGNRWAMTERGRGAVHRNPSSLAIGPSSFSWDGDVLTIRIDEVTVPFPSRIRGQVRLHPTALVNHEVNLDATGQHRWSAIAPRARIEVMLDHPQLHWEGDGYLDTNAGSSPLEQAFRGWTWCRATLRDETVVLYDVAHRNGESLSFALRFDAAGKVEEFAPPPIAKLPRSMWHVGRSTRADEGHAAGLVQTLEDGPFYARSVLATHLLGRPATAVHESLSLDRFSKRWVQMLLPFRMPRMPG